jgi:putative PIN family toxin of toxin-antitoxin system
MKVVLDTNVIFSAFAARGLANAVFELCLDKHTIIISEHILSELQSNLQKKLKMPRDKVQLTIEYLREFCLISDFKRLDRRICRDIDDVKILGLSEMTKPNYIITGDADLLALKEYNAVPIITPREFWEISKGGKRRP